MRGKSANLNCISVALSDNYICHSLRLDKENYVIQSGRNVLKPYQLDD